MQNIDDLKEIVRAMQELGNAWHEENISLRSENERLLAENKNLRAENESLRREFDNLSEKVTVLKNELRKEILDELNATAQEDFQKFVKNYLGDIRKKLNEATIKPEKSLPYDKPEEETIAPQQDEIQNSDEQPNYFGKR